ncbi:MULTISPECIES: GolD/DthD family dehydrogenase [unclassified Delftia]|uniref:GolD/DthD family dehydrogenase n=1 Tax=unclassified Delftia TaxID=2613839 RepID=UPI001900EE45|nr:MULTISPECIES: D-threitol dehydrogenase [unclassified Delftia]MBK0111141.1 D-threitol dehydrogenase [Delftia sp. S65]MBK0117090.1 D-threitol dehydrogenase [Delftia sp. S67]MBK0128314.1 D-threitol dehydrogenase [Delftia sp. S66]
MSADSLERDFDGRTALVTGGAGGIGLAIARQLAEGGARVVLVDLERQALDAAAASLAEPRHHLALAVDVTRPAGVEQVVATVLEATGRIDILVNSAGVALLEPAGEVSEAAWERTLAVNLTAPLLLAQAVAPAMRRQRHGRIINLASQASVVALRRHAAYCASKAGLVGLTRVLALEWATDGITVNAISPTVVDTPLGRKAWAGQVGEAMRALIPTGRFAQPEEVARLAVFLAGTHAGMLTGENIVIDGGYSIQ